MDYQNNCQPETLPSYAIKDESDPRSLRSVVRPFTEKQLLDLYHVDGLENNESFIDNFLQVSLIFTYDEPLINIPLGMHKNSRNGILYKVRRVEEMEVSSIQSSRVNSIIIGIV